MPYAHFRDDPLNQPLDINGNPLPGGPWLRVGNMDGSTGDGIYGSNNGLIGIVLCGQLAAGQGEVDASSKHRLDPDTAVCFVAPYSQVNWDTINTMGFRSGLWVPLSNGEVPKNLYEQQFRDLRLQLSESTSLMGSVCIIRAEFRRPGESAIAEVKPATAGNEILTYAVNDAGLMTIVDINGNIFVRRDSPATRKFYDDNGYRTNPRLQMPLTGREELVGPWTDVTGFFESHRKTIPFQRQTIALEAAAMAAAPPIIANDSSIAEPATPPSISVAEAPASKPGPRSQQSKGFGRTLEKFYHTLVR